jgi:ABC-2 type transport system ATP-binding protein
MDRMIVLTNLTKRFGQLLAVDNVTMSVSAGEVLGFLGPNGAGKSTTMKMIAGFLEPTGGTATVCGHDVTRAPVEVKRVLGYLPEGAPTYGDMTPLSYLRFIAEIRGFDGAERQRRVDAMVEKVALHEVLRQPIETLSKGFKRRVGLAQTMLHDPPVLIMDEPTDGLDPNQKRHVRSLIRDMAEEKAIIISTHILEEVEAVCSRAVIIARGRIRADGRPYELRSRAPDHNAVLVTADETDIRAIREGLSALSGVGDIETLERWNGQVRLRVLPKQGESIGTQVGELIQAQKLRIRELFVEQGSLDDMFWEITEGEDQDIKHNA